MGTDTHAEKSRRWSAAITSWLFMALVLIARSMLSRLGFLDDLMWLRSEPPGAVTSSWLLRETFSSMIAALVGAFLGYRGALIGEGRKTESSR
jgi:hypothetical protein